MLADFYIPVISFQMKKTEKSEVWTLLKSGVIAQEFKKRNL